MTRPGQHDPEPDIPDPPAQPPSEIPDDPVVDPPRPPGPPPPITAYSDINLVRLTRARRIGLIH